MADARKLARELLAKHGAARTPASEPGRPPSTDLGEHPQVRAALDIRNRVRQRLVDRGMPSPFFLPHNGVNGAVTHVLDGEVVNFSSYNYLGLAGDPRVMAAAKDAIDDHGTSASASRAAGGEIALYGELERKLAAAYGVADAVITASGYLTNAGVIPFLLGPDDLAVHDSLVHNSVIAGTRWAGCKRAAFHHNDPSALDALLTRSRGRFARALLIVEGVYSMDGDIAPLPELIEVARRHGCLIMVDEAHSFGTLGGRGLGIREHFGLPGDAVDLWMGTLSKALASCGGYLAGDADVIWAIRMLAPGVGLFVAPPTPAQAAAASTALDVLLAEPDRVDRLRRVSDTARTALRAAEWDIGTSAGTPIVPVVLGDTETTLEASVGLLAAGVQAAPIAYPAVAEGEARLRLFMSGDHTAEHVDRMVAGLSAVTAADRGGRGVP